MSLIGAKITGLKAVAKKMKELGGDYQAATAVAIYQEGTAIMAESLKQVPVDTGRLRASHYVAPPKDQRDPVVVLGYGVRYAAAVHEDTSKRHGPSYTDPKGNSRGSGQKSKFLSDPMNAARRGYKSRIKKRADNNFAKGVKFAANSAFPTSPRT